MAEAAVLCAGRVRKGDPDRFAATMASPVAVRGLLWPLYALNLEVGRSAWASTEPMICEMRVQWWVDALIDLAQTGRQPNHELGAELLVLRPVADRLVGLAEGRRKDCWREAFTTQAELWQYLRDTNGVIFVAAGQLCGATPAECDALLEYGACVGMASWLRAAPDLTAHGWRALPLSGEDQGVLAQSALRNLDAALSPLRKGSSAARLAMLPGWMARPHLARFAANQGAETSEFYRRLRLLWASFRV